MNKNSEPNAQNSELDPIAHPSGARIEKMMKRAESNKAANKAANQAAGQESGREIGQETGTFGDQLRDSEKPDRYDVISSSVVEVRSAASQFVDPLAVEGKDELPNRLDNPPENAKGGSKDGHRSSPNNREI